MTAPGQNEATSIAQTDFGPLALWLALTTNQAFVRGGKQGETPAQSIASATGVDVAKVQTYLQAFASSTPLTAAVRTEADVFNFVSKRFQDLAKDVMTLGYYPENGCPKTLDAIQAVASLGLQESEPGQ